MAVVSLDERSAAAGIAGVANQPLVRRFPVCASIAHQRTVLHRRRVEDRLRPVTLPGIPRGSATGGGDDGPASDGNIAALTTISIGVTRRSTSSICPALRAALMQRP